MQHDAVQYSGNVDEFSCDFFKEFDLGRCHGGSVVNLCHLLFGPVVGRHVARGRVMVLLWESVLELDDFFFNVAIHGSFESVICIVPVKVDANIFVAFPVRLHGVVVLECSLEVEGVGFVDIFDSEVVNDESERDGSGLVEVDPGVYLEG